MTVPPKGRKPRPAPLSVRVNQTELDILRARAGNRPLSTYLKQAALGSEGAPMRKRVLPPSADKVLLGQLLARLGQSHLANNLNQLARAANLGVLPVSPETEDDLRWAYAEICEMRRVLLSALGVIPAEPISDAFAASAGAPPP